MKNKDKKEKKKIPMGMKILRVILIIVLILLCLFAALVIVLTVTEYKPADEEAVEINVNEDATELSGVQSGQSLRVVTWNCGYGALGDNADFFMDGGSMVKTATEDRVQENLATIYDEIHSLNPDFLFLQEVDVDSTRSYHIDEASFLGAGEPNWDFAYNYKVLFVPYPIPPIGEVNGGIMTASEYEMTDATRIALPCPFSWPVRLGNLKRCLLVNRVPVLDEDGNDTGKELVLVNLHLEAYDDGEGKAAQTAALKDFLVSEYEKGNYVIAGGDFNQTFSGTDTSMYPEKEGTWHCGSLDESEFPDYFQFAMDNTYPTCRSLDQPYAGADKETFQYYMIDGFIVSDNVTIDEVATQDCEFVASDHEPVVLDVTLE